MRKIFSIPLIAVALLALLAVGTSVAVWRGASPSVGACADAKPAGRFTAHQLRAADGNCLQAYAWVAADKPVVGVAVLVHGLHDHARRYEPLALALNAAGVAVYAHDHRGHGASGGASQRMDSIAQLVSDVDQNLQEAAKRHPGVPVFIYGHSMGGLVVAQLVAREGAREAERQPAGQPVRLRGAIISSAALKLPPSASAGQLRVVAALSSIAPNLGLEAVDEATVVREPAARALLAADPLIRRSKLPARTVATLLGGIGDIQARMATINLPLLILHGKADKVTEVQGSRELAERAKNSDKTLKIYDLALHDLLHEPEAAEVTREIVGFVSARLGQK